jgi:hypothetical protein
MAWAFTLGFTLHFPHVNPMAGAFTWGFILHFPHVNIMVHMDMGGLNSLLKGVMRVMIFHLHGEGENRNKDGF